MEKLIEYDKNKNIINNLIKEGNYKVVSVIGENKSDKNIFLNFLITKLKHNNEYIFPVSLNKYSNNINYYIYDNILFLRIDSTYNNYDQNICKLVLFSYLISDLIILTHNKNYEHFSLRNFLPFTTLISKIDKNNVSKPKLFVKINNNNNQKINIKEELDILLKKNIKDNDLILYLFDNKGGSHYDYSYKEENDKNRDIMFLLFSEIDGSHTNELTKKENKILEDHNYSEIINKYMITLKDDTNYINCLNKVINKIETIKPKYITNDLINKLVNNINNS